MPIERSIGFARIMFRVSAHWKQGFDAKNDLTHMPESERD